MAESVDTSATEADPTEMNSYADVIDNSKGDPDTVPDVAIVRRVSDLVRLTGAGDTCPACDDPWGLTTGGEAVVVVNTHGGTLVEWKRGVLCPDHGSDPDTVREHYPAATHTIRVDLTEPPERYCGHQYDSHTTDDVTRL